MPSRRSGLQRDVSSLFRQYLRMILQKPPVRRPHASPLVPSLKLGPVQETRAAWFQFVSHEFRKHGDVRARDVGTIEYLLRRGRNSLENYADRSTTSVAVPYGAEYPRGWLVNRPDRSSGRDRGER